MLDSSGEKSGARNLENHDNREKEKASKKGGENETD